MKRKSQIKKPDYLEKQITVQSLISAMTRALETNIDTINALNVFPVPDGDTGTNMVLTLRSINEQLSAPEEQSSGYPINPELIARSALLGARGNSGLIVAQFFKGLAESIARTNEIDGQLLANTLQLSTQYAYKSVQKPVEGTMLTVFSDCSTVAKNTVKNTNDFESVLAVVASQAMETVRKTPLMLDVLRNAGVVDSGGFGFAVMLAGALHVTRGDGDGSVKIEPPRVNLQESNSSEETVQKFIVDAEEEIWGYCTVFALEGQNLDIENIRMKFDSMGRSAVVAGDENLVKVHVHLQDPGLGLSLGTKLGTLSYIDIKNMDEQTREWVNKQQDEKEEKDSEQNLFEVAVVSVCLGSGFTELFKNAGLGALVPVMREDTMNPSTSELVSAVESAPSNNVILLPNNQKVIGTANLVNALTEKNVIVIPTKTMQSGLVALLSFSPDRNLHQNNTEMKAATSTVTSGAICRATRTISLNNIAIKKGQFMGLLEEKVVACEKDLITTLIHVIRGQTHEDSLVTLYSGSSVAAKEIDKANAVVSELVHPAEVQSVSGGQKDYEFLISIE